MRRLFNFLAEKLNTSTLEKNDSNDQIGSVRMASDEIDYSGMVQRFLGRLGERLKEYRLKNDYTQDELAKALQYADKSSIAKWELGIKQPSLTQIVRLCAIYGCTFNDILGGLDDEKDERTIEFVRRTPPSKLLTEDCQTDVQRGVEILSALTNGKTLEELYELPSLSRYQGNRDILMGFLRNALFSGEVTFTHIPLAKELQEQLTSVFPHLAGSVFVVDIPDTMPDEALPPELVGWVASRFTLSTLEKPQRVGLAGSYTLSRMCHITPPKTQQFNGTQWIPLIAYQEREERNSRSASHLVELMKYRHHNSTSVYLPYVPPDKYLGHVSYEETLALWERLNVAFVTGFAWNDKDKGRVPSTYGRIFRRLEHSGLVDNLAGEFVGYILDDDGNILGGEETLQAMNAATTRIPLENLQQCVNRTGKIYFVGAGSNKARIVRVALTHDYINGLVIDSCLAKALLK